MNHPTLEELLDIRDGEGSADAMAHVESCALCTAEVDRLRDVALALRALPDLEPARDRWPEVRGILEAEQRAWIPRAVGGTVLALAASLLIVMILPRDTRPQAPQPSSAAAASITDEEIAELVNESQQLERLLRRGRPEGQVMDAWRASTVADLEDRIALIDSQLADDRYVRGSPEMRGRLWRTRVGLMNQLVRTRAVRPAYVEF
jgi:hypothetical protein